ncbi:MAG TPA: UDP-N-acetylmuramate--L-alanine ligase [Oscillospiraceae bacterium]|nr:UDP-N-acetylmuramate--L-alanine ligase [Oscillospiraceae bacterium]
MLKDIKHIHFIGIGGYGMSALARVLLDIGYIVSGSDKKQSAITAMLQKEGAVVYQDHRGTNITGAELVIYSTAIAPDNVELVAAKQAKLPVWHRSELLAQFINGRFGIAIAGAHGKTTTTSMVAAVLTRGQLDPTAFIGGIFHEFNGNSRIGKSELVVAEADESDNTFLRYRPRIAVVTNIDADHLEHYQGDFRLLLNAYREFLNNVAADGTAVLCADDPYLRDMRPTHLRKVVTYGLEEGDWRAENLQEEGWRTRFTVIGPTGMHGEIALPVPGRHNVLNALAAVAVAQELKVDFSAIREGLESFHGADRRFQILCQENDIVVVDDYAHHPTEIRATIQATRAGHNKRLLIVFQPHRFSRTKCFFNEFVQAFAGADKVFLQQIYAASEKPLEGISSGKLAEEMRARGMDVTQLDRAEDIIEQVLAMAQPGDLIITMGAGDVTEIGHKIAESLQTR